MGRTLVAFITVGLLAAPPFAFGQHGDVRGEIQAPPPEHLEIPPAPVLSADEALTTFRLPLGFHVEIVAAEPLVHDPVAMSFDPDGRLWIVEMSGFMRDPDGAGEDAKVGTIAVLEDTDGDGQMDKRTEFLSGLVMPRALGLVDGGVLVAEPPHLWFCRDTNGDGVCDEKTEIASDYGGTTNPEHTANGLMWALDNWIYSANYTFRFRYEGNGAFTREPTTTRGQWGISQDDTGRIFFNSNSDPLRADLVPSQYFRRNPNLAAPAGVNVQLVSAKLPVWPGRVTPGINRGYRSLTSDGKMSEVTAACGPVIYRGAMFPADFEGNAFICEPAGNLIKRIVLEEHDGTLTGHNAYEGMEFLTSTDERFRPVNLANGPDGALYVVDMYRGVIQHRIYMTTYLRKQVEERKLAEGIGMGRIYRIVADGGPGIRRRPNLTRESSKELVAHLRDANGWWRDTAQRLLVERRDPAITSSLRDLATNAPEPLARLHALWTLDGLDALDRATALRAIGDADPRVCAAAIRVSEKFLSPPGDPEIFARVRDLIGARREPAVRLQLAFSLGEVGTPRGDAALRELAAVAGAQPFIADAIVSGIAGREIEFIDALSGEFKNETDAPDDVVKLATSAVLRSRDPARITTLFSKLDGNAGIPSWKRRAILDGVERFLPRTPDGRLVRGVLPVKPEALIALAAQTTTAEGKRAAKLVDLLRWPGKPGAQDDSAAMVSHFSTRQKALFEKGRAQFAAICAACHQPNGEGLAGLAPPLLYSRWVLGNDRVLARIVLNGKEDEGRVMPPLKGALDDETIAGILTFIRSSWGHNARPVSPRTISEVRGEVARRDEPWSDEELQSLLD